MGSYCWSRISMLVWPPMGWRWDQHPRPQRRCTANLASLWTSNSSGGRQVSASIALVEVVLITPVIPKHASFCTVLSLFGTSSLVARPPNKWCKRDGCPNDRYVEPVDNLGSQAPHCTKLWAFLTLTSTCSLQVSRESRTTPKYFTSIEQCKLTPRKCPKKSGVSFPLWIQAQFCWD